jgi:tetratricopeptide (TPR) repeat protein
MVTGDGPPVLVEVDHSRYMPSVVVVDREGQLLAGDKALRQAAVFPERAVRVPKRALVAGPSVILGDAAMPVTELVAAVLRRVHSEARRFQGDQPPEAVVLTHPARWGNAPLERLREAAAKAGIDAPVLLPEPVAAAWWFGAPGQVAHGSLVGVFDFGGGTLDTAVLRAVPGGFTIAGPPGGDAHLGGEDFDELLFERVSELARDRDQLTWPEVFEAAGARARRELALLRADVTAAKEALSEANAYDVLVPGFDEEFRITRPELAELLAPKLDDAVAEMRATITAAGAEPASLDGLYLTGGSSRIPLVAARLAADLGVQPQLRDDPKAAVVLGALTYLRAGAPTPAAPEALARAEALLAGYEGDGLEAACREAVRLNPGSAIAHSGLGLALGRLGRRYEAEQEGREAVRLDPALAIAHARLGAALVMRGKAAKAMAAVQEALRLDSSSYEARMMLALILFDQGHRKKAQALLTECASAPGRLERLRTTYTRGAFDRALKDYAAARTNFQQVIDGGSPWFAVLGLVQLGTTLMQEKNFAAARLAFERAIESRHVLAYRGLEKLVELLAEQQDVAGARAVLESAISSGRPELVPTAAYQLGRLLNKPASLRGDARAAYQRAIDSGHPEISSQAALELGEILKKTKDFAGASAAFQFADTSGHPDYGPRAGYELAKLHKELLRVDEAKAAYAAVAASPHELAVKAAAELGDILRDTGDLDGASAAYQQAAGAAGLLTDPHWAWSFGVRLAQGEPRLAQAVFETIAGSDGRYAFEAARSLGDMLRKDGDTEAATASYVRAINLLRGSGIKPVVQAGGLESAYRFGLEVAKAGRPDMAKSVFEQVRDFGTGDDVAPYAQAAKLAIKHLPTLAADLNGANGKITVNRKWSFAGWGGGVGIRIDESRKESLIGESASLTRNVPPGPHVIRGEGATEKGWIVVYIAPGKRVQVQCSLSWKTVDFTLVG